MVSATVIVVILLFAVMALAAGSFITIIRRAQNIPKFENDDAEKCGESAADKVETSVHITAPIQAYAPPRYSQEDCPAYLATQPPANPPYTQRDFPLASKLQRDYDIPSTPAYADIQHFLHDLVPRSPEPLSLIPAPPIQRLPKVLGSRKDRATPNFSRAGTMLPRTLKRDSKHFA